MKVFTWEASAVNMDLADFINDPYNIKPTSAFARILTEVLPLKIWITDAAGNATYFNDHYLNFLGASADDIEGWGWTRTLHPDDVAPTEAAWKEALGAGIGYTIQHRIKSKDGDFYWHLSNAMPLKDSSGRITLWAGSSTDIHEQKVLEQMQNEFISIASHELKTPLTTVKAYMQLIDRSTKYNAKVHSLSERASVNIERLERLVGDMLEVSKINAGKLDYALELHPINDIISDAVKNMREIQTTHKIIFEPDENVSCCCDSFRIQQVMMNFLSNAVKYSPAADRVIVKTRVDVERVVVSVQDFGIGILPADRERLFSRFYRVTAVTRNFQGAGLGLYIVSEILNRHHAELWVESEEGRGSTFNFSLRIAHSCEN